MDKGNPSEGISGDESSEDANKLSAQDTFVIKKSNSSHKRNYRQSSGIADESSDEEPVSSSSRLDSKVSEGDEKSTRRPEDEKCLESNCGKNSETKDGESAKNESSTSETPTAGPSSNGSGEEVEIESNEGACPRVSDPSAVQNHPHSSDSEDSERFNGMDIYPAGFEFEDDDDMSSASSSLLPPFEDDMEDDSDSESSDSFLEDLEDERSPPRSGSNRNDKKSEAKKSSKPAKIPKVLEKPKPKSNWCGPKEILKREMGYRGNVQPQTDETFRSKFYGSLYSAERLELMKKLEGHEGCVNSLNFNYSGSLLCSGSDDLTIKIWDYNQGKLITSVDSGHASNVFQTKFVPLLGIDSMIVSSARDGAVRLTTLNSAGSIASSRKLVRHRGDAHKLSINPETPQVLLSCGEDGTVFSIDIRDNKPQKILKLKKQGMRYALYSIHCNPQICSQFCVAGRDEYIRVYDTRKLSRCSVPRSDDEASFDSIITDDPTSSNLRSNDPIARFCPHHLQGKKNMLHVTSAVYNYNGTEIVGSYNDDNIYLFNANHSDLADYIKLYEGHRNSVTVKGVNFFGDKSQFVVSGSDCGHIFVWDKETESIVNFLRGDETGVVNSLEPHPTSPILATSGLDSDIKIWLPSSESPNKMGDLAPTVRKNIRRREQQTAQDDNSLESHIMLQLFRNHLFSFTRRRRENGLNTDSSNSSNEDDSPEYDPAAHARAEEACCIM